MKPSFRLHRPARNQSSLPDLAYGSPEHSLSQYGLAYVCRHPEILLGYAPNRGSRRYELGFHEGATWRAQEPIKDGLARRVDEAYNVLNELYAPVAMTPMPRPGAPSQTSYGRRTYRSRMPQGYRRRQTYQ